MRAWLGAAAAVIAVGAVLVSADGMAATDGSTYLGSRVVSVPPAKACETTQPSTGAAAGGVSHRIRYVATASTPPPLATHFAGQPSWLEQPEWPTSRSTGKQLTFIGQIAIDAAQFPKARGAVAYLFMADGPDDVDYIWDPDAGENAVIIQPGDPGKIPVVTKATGPTESSVVFPPGARLGHVENLTYRVETTDVIDPEYQTAAELASLSDAEEIARSSALIGDKIGGTPEFVQGGEFPCRADRLLLQIEATPFQINLGDGGAGFLFVNENATVGNFLWQSH